MKGLRLATLVAVLLAAIGTEGQPSAQSGRTPRLVRQSITAGTWQSQRDSWGRRNWQVQLKRFDGDSLTGRLTVVGSARIRQAKIVGQISGSDV